jgi:hypothetical protein
MPSLYPQQRKKAQFLWKKCIGQIIVWTCDSTKSTWISFALACPKLFSTTHQLNEQSKITNLGGKIRHKKQLPSIGVHKWVSVLAGNNPTLGSNVGIGVDNIAKRIFIN